MEQNGEARNKPKHIWSTNIWQKNQEYSMKNHLFNKWYCENWIYTCKRMKLDPYLPPLTKISLKQIKNLNVRPRQNIRKQRHHFAGKGPYSVKAMAFPEVRYGCESWPIQKAECQRTDAFHLFWWRRLLRVPWTARGSNQSVLKEINPEYSLQGLMLKLKLQNFGHLIWRADSLEKTLMLGKTEGKRRSGQ